MRKYKRVERARSSRDELVSDDEDGAGVMNPFADVASPSEVSTMEHSPLSPKQETTDAVSAPPEVFDNANGIRSRQESFDAPDSKTADLQQIELVPTSHSPEMSGARESADLDDDAAPLPDSPASPEVPAKRKHCWRRCVNSCWRSCFLVHLWHDWPLMDCQQKISVTLGLMLVFGGAGISLYQVWVTVMMRCPDPVPDYALPPLTPAQHALYQQQHHAFGTAILSALGLGGSSVIGGDSGDSGSSSSLRGDGSRSTNTGAGALSTASVNPLGASKKDPFEESYPLECISLRVHLLRSPLSEDLNATAGAPEVLRWIRDLNKVIR
jgi:hypothetical protein